MSRTKLELTWIGKDNRPRLEPRILLEDPELSYHAQCRVTDSDIFDNRLIFGDNLLALKALEQEFAGKIKCICIDPPYNTGSAFTHYDDGIEHSLWLTMMRDRISLMRRLLATDGSLWVFVDGNEMHYLKILCDEEFGRNNHVETVVWQRKASPANDAKWFSSDHDYILVYAANKDLWRPNKNARTSEQDTYYTNPDNDPRGPWNSVTYTCNKSAEERPNLYYPITNPFTSEEVWPKRTAVWRCNPGTHRSNVEQGLLYWGKEGKARYPRLKRFLSDAKPVVPRSVWLHDDVGHTQTGMLESKSLFPDIPFPTPKPEGVVQRIIQLGSNPGDWVLDSFAGSGTTGAVAHKMGRRWIMVELGEHCHTHIVPRMRKVIDGEDQVGISKAVGWKGGGGFRYYRLAPSLLQEDKWGNPIINKDYNAEMLAEAMCKHMCFTYDPSDTVYWQHGHSTENDFIYVTTQTLNHSQIAQLSEEVGEERTLLICCTAFRANRDEFANLTIKKIPKMVLNRCEFGKDDYSLQISSLPEAPYIEEKTEPSGNGKRQKQDKQTLTLFGEETQV
ncbi:MAG: site-specific DNA-methyltransferase [Armatimonadetes bacterium]|nr:site-specific DNA-methyltransferase [Armatimonadota bacterium]